MILRNARTWQSDGFVDRDLGVRKGLIAEVGDGPEADLAGRVVLPGLVNAHDHLDFSTFPLLGRPPYRSAYEWAADVKAGEGDPRVRAALVTPLVDRLFLGGFRNLLAGATAVAHHNPWHRSLGRPDFPVRVLARYDFAHSPGLTPELKRTYRTTDRRIPWMVHAGEGVDERSRGDLAMLREENVLRQNTVLVHGIAFGPEDAVAIAAARACVVWCPESNQRLYGRTADVAGLRAAGVRVGLGSDSPASGARDPLSNLAAARQAGVFADDVLLDLATRGSAEVARLPLGGLAPGEPADLVVIDSREAFLSGDRRAIALVLVAGRALYGRPDIMDALAPAPATALLEVDGEARSLEAGLARKAAALLKAPLAAAWTKGLSFPR